MNNKKGLSAIVATLIIILLVIVAFGIVSVVVRQTVTSGAEQIELNAKCLEVEIRATKVVQATDPSGNAIPGQWDVTLSRSLTGDFPIDGVDLIFEDESGDNRVTKTIVRTDIQRGDGFTEQVAVPEITLPGRVTVVPYLLTKAGTVHTCASSFVFEDITLAPSIPPAGIPTA